MKNSLTLIATKLIIILAPQRICRGFGPRSARSVDLLHRIVISGRSPQITKRMQQVQVAPSADSTTEEKVVRILCLHGKGGNGQNFVGKALGPLRRLIEIRLDEMDAREKISFEWDSLTAPFEISSERNIDDYNKGFSWWCMPPGTRSFNAKEYEGFSESEDMVMNALRSKDGGFDIVLGHSQGAILAASLISIHSKMWSEPHYPKGFIFNGVAWPNPYSDNMRTLPELIQHKNSRESLPRMLFIMGNADDINPLHSAKQVSDAYRNAGFDVSVAHHDGGHSVPYNNNDDSQQALNKTVDWIMSIAGQK